VVEEASLLAINAEWIYDTGDSRHFCTNKELMHDFKDMIDGECIYKGNCMTTRVMGKGKILLKLLLVN